MNERVIESILQDRQIGYAITDDQLNVLEIGGWIKLFYRRPQTEAGQSLFDLAPELVGSEAILADIISGKLPHFRLDLVNREIAPRQLLYLTLVVLPHFNRTGQINGLLFLTENVTEMGVLEQRLLQQRNELRLLRDQLAQQNLDLALANAELQQLDEMKSIFVSVTAHELRTPLASISGFAEMLLDELGDPLTKQQRDYLEIIERAAQRLLKITKNLLDVTRLEAGRMELVLKPTLLADLIEPVVSEFAPQLEAKQQLLTVELPPENILVMVQETRAIQIIGNLLGNAGKYTAEGGQISLRAALAEVDGFLQISIADTGLGIPAEDQAKLFTRFFRAGNANQTRAAGTGLGLYITRSLVELHGGQIWFESELNRGSTFHVTFPLADKIV